MARTQKPAAPSAAKPAATRGRSGSGTAAKPAAAKAAVRVSKGAAGGPAKADTAKPAPRARARTSAAAAARPAPGARSTAAAHPVDKAAPARPTPAKAAVAKAAPDRAGTAKAAPDRAGTAKAAPVKPTPPKTTRARTADGRRVPVDKFLAEQQLLLLQERDSHVRQAESLKDEADALAAAMEPGESEFGEEGGEGGNLSVERELDLVLSAQAKAAVDEIERALAKIDTGAYGTCEKCGKEIPRARLKVLPHAPLCVACKSGGLSRR
jgi:DnaK suppressor protein